MADDSQQARAVLQLAQSLFDYGQHSRTLALLDLYDWLNPDEDIAFELRIRTLLKLRRLEDAKALCKLTSHDIANDYLAEIYWGLGEKEIGDKHFSNSQNL